MIELLVLSILFIIFGGWYVIRKVKEELGDDY